jgi:hypothetical protein
MTINEMSSKFRTANGNMAVRELDTIVSGGSADDFVQNGTIARLIQESTVAYYDERISKNATSIIMERCKLNDDGTIEGTGEAVQVPLGIFDRAVTVYKKEADGSIVRVPDKEPVRAEGTAVTDWKKSENAKVFVTDNMGKAIKFVVKSKEKTRAWNRSENAWSTTELRDQQVYKCDWVVQ